MTQGTCPESIEESRVDLVLVRRVTAKNSSSSTFKALESQDKWRLVWERVTAKVGSRNQGERVGE